MLVLGLGLGMVMQVLVLAVAERRRLRAPRRRDRRLDALPVDRRLDRRRALRRRSSPTGSRRTSPSGCRRGRTCRPRPTRRRSRACRRRCTGRTSSRSRRRCTRSSSSPRRSPSSRFALTWLLREVPLRKTVEAEGVGESFAMPRDATSLPEMERIVATLARRENRWRLYEQLGERAGLDLAPDEHWLLARLGEGRRSSSTTASPARSERLRERGLVSGASLSPAGAALYERILAARRAGARRADRRLGPGGARRAARACSTGSRTSSPPRRRALVLRGAGKTARMPSKREATAEELRALTDGPAAASSTTLTTDPKEQAAQGAHAGGSSTAA